MTDSGISELGAWSRHRRILRVLVFFSILHISESICFVVRVDNKIHIVNNAFVVSLRRNAKLVSSQVA